MSPSLVKQIIIKYALLGSQLITINLSSSSLPENGWPVLNNCSPDLMLSQGSSFLPAGVLAKN